MTNEELNTKLYERMFAEQEKYRDWLLTQPPEEILHHAYEYTARQDILMALENNDLEDAQASALLDADEPLAEVFRKYERMESDYMNTIWDCMEERADELLAARRETPVYRQSAAYAREHEELPQFRASHNTNIACRDAMEQAISENYDGRHLNTEAIVAQVAEKFGQERMQYVLAATVQAKDWDGRFSRENKAWAKSVPVADGTTTWGGNRNTEFTLNQAHPVLVDAVVSRMRKKPSVLDALQRPVEPPKAGAKSREPSL